MRRFTDEEKLRAVDLYFEKNITTKEVADRLGYPTLTYSSSVLIISPEKRSFGAVLSLGSGLSIKPKSLLTIKIIENIKKRSLNFVIAHASLI